MMLTRRAGADHGGHRGVAAIERDGSPFRTRRCLWRGRAAALKVRRSPGSGRRFAGQLPLSVLVLFTNRLVPMRF
jgi:hypothetical protein